MATLPWYDARGVTPMIEERRAPWLTALLAALILMGVCGFLFWGKIVPSATKVKPFLRPVVAAISSDMARIRVFYGHRILRLRNLTYTKASFFSRVKAGDLAAVRAFLDAGMKPDAEDPKGFPALFYAVMARNRAMAELLMDRGADVNRPLPGPFGLLLDIAAYRGWRDMADLLVSRGGLKAHWSWLAFDYVSPLSVAVDGGHQDMVEFLISKGVPVNAYSNPPLSIAAQRGRIEIAELLISHGADVNARSQIDLAPLDGAARFAKVEMAQLLIDKGARVDASGKRSRETPLFWAAVAGNEDVARLLVSKGADIRGRGDRVPLDAAIEGGHEGVVRFLISKGAKVNPGGHGMELLLAVRGQNARVLSLMLEKGASLEARDKQGNTPLIEAAAYGRTDLARILIAHGADVNARGNHRLTPLIWAAGTRNRELIELLLSKGAGPPGLNLKKPWYCSVLEFVIFWGDTRMVEHWIARGADVNAVDRYGQTSLDYVDHAPNPDHWYLVGLLRSHGARPGPRKPFRF